MITFDFKRLCIKSGFRILDIGCGTGRHVCEAFRFEQVFVVGADINIKDLGEAKNRLIDQEQIGEHGNGSWTIALADITCLPFRENSFDLVICSEILEHVKNHENAICEVIRVLKPGMNLAVSVPRYLPERICWGLSNEYHHSDQGHIRIYKKKELIALVESFGAKTWAVHFAHSLHTVYWWLKCIVGPKREDSAMINLYHRFLVWDMMKHPPITRMIERLLNVVLGKSLVLYFKKRSAVPYPQKDTG